jgi:hypothetical protein
MDGNETSYFCEYMIYNLLKRKHYYIIFITYYIPIRYVEVLGQPKATAINMGQVYSSSIKSILASSNTLKVKFQTFSIIVWPTLTAQSA